MPDLTDYKPATRGSPRWRGAKLQGWLRFQEGWEIGGNPFAPGSPDFYLWQEGWMAGENGWEALDTIPPRYPLSRNYISRPMFKDEH